MPDYKPTIGLEIHAELKTSTKMFCDSKNDPDERRPNVNICPVCMAHPGTLPVINKKAVEHIVRIGLAVGGNIADFTEFDRKNYFYPDIPKGYQISQYKFPIVVGGSINGVALTRVHLEEDTARSIHLGIDPEQKSNGSSHDQGDYSLIDYNRAGVPLMELVTEPVIHDSDTAVAFAKELQLLLRYLGAGEANMEKGEMRVEANISIREIADSPGQGTGQRGKVLGTKVEVKNINSFRAVERAIKYEIDRQSALLEKGEKVVQETRGWDDAGQKTFSQRLKESSHDYRYFPEPDLPKLSLSKVPEFTPDIVKKNLPELPWERRKRYLEMGLKLEDANMFVGDEMLGGFFERVSKVLGDTKKAILASNYIASDVAGLLSKGEGGKIENITPENFASLIEMVSANEISSRGAKDILAEMYMKGGDPKVVANEKGILQKSDTGELEAIAQKVIGENKGVAEEYKAGKTTSLQFLIGQGMKASRGSANPQVLKEVFEKLLKN